jgi:hypothetical protein
MTRVKGEGVPCHANATAGRVPLVVTSGPHNRPGSTPPLFVVRSGAMACVSYRSHPVGPTVGGPVIPPQNPACHAGRRRAKVVFGPERDPPEGDRAERVDALHQAA